MKAVLALTALFASQLAIGAQVSIVPESPKSLDAVYVHVPSSGVPMWAHPTVALSNGKITVTIHDPDALLEGPVPDLDWPMGQLPEGSYQVEVVYQPSTGSSQSIGSTSFSVSSIPSTSPKADYSDMWWVPTESGWGLSLQQHPSGIMFAAWFVYGGDGKPTWYVVPNGRWQSDVVYSGVVYKTTGPFFGAAFNPSQVTVQAAGTAQITFRSALSAFFAYTIDGVSGSKEIVRQQF